ncbi:MAG TPA: glycosyltransferase family A protein [Candidatus Limnocylindrales bacterium]|nr:glycosyltransferase family A protein [Candidatus Limnocylindrales bacterium]
MTPRISIIIPTHNRSEMLPRTLGALAKQTTAPEDYEVIVVADGCQDSTSDVVRSLQLPYTLIFVEQPALGAAAARNHGARLATAPLLLFLDDDMEATPELVRAHLTTHTAYPGGVVLGYFPVAVRENITDIFEISVKLWWDKGFQARSQPSHRFTFWDFCTGNVSLPRQLFNDLGGFDERFHGKAGEDYEFGIRLLKRRVRFRFIREAASIHHGELSLERSLQRATAEGQGQSLIVQKHPEVFREFSLSRPVSGPILRPLWYLLWRQPVLATLLAQILRVPLRVARACKFSSLMERIYGCLHSYFYWRGVKRELGSLSALRRLQQDAPLEPITYHEIELDVATDMPRLEAILNENPVDAVRLRYGTIPLGRIAPMIGAEPLRPVHVREALIYQYGTMLLGLYMLDQLEHSSPIPQTLQRNGGLKKDANIPS